MVVTLHYQQQMYSSFLSLKKNHLMKCVVICIDEKLTSMKESVLIELRLEPNLLYTQIVHIFYENHL